MGELALAQTCAEESWRLTQETGDIWSGIGLNNLGDIALDRGIYTQAVEYYQRWLALTWEVGDMATSANIFWKLSRVEKAQGKFDQVRLLLKNGLSIADEIGDRLIIFHILAAAFLSEQLGPAVLETALIEGRRMSLPQLLREIDLEGATEISPLS